MDPRSSERGLDDDDDAEEAMRRRTMYCPEGVAKALGERRSTRCDQVTLPLEGLTEGTNPATFGEDGLEETSWMTTWSG